MFDKLLRELRKLERGVNIPIEIPLDEDGYMDRQCPANACQSDFKVLFDDWRAKVSDDRVYCPICRHEAEASEWNTPEQEECMQQAAMKQVQSVGDRGLRSSARDFNRRSSRNSGFIKMSMSVQPGRSVVVVPAAAADEMRQKFTCEACGCRYASIGAAFFCPACGHNSAVSTFDQTIGTVHKTLNGIDTVRQALADQFDEDVAKDSVRQMLENTMGRLVGAFQRLAEALFDQLPNRSRFNPRRNLFQNLGQSSDLWEEAGKARYERLLTSGEYAELQRLFQQRHLIAHQDGIVDQEYVDRSGDTLYVVGQRLVIREPAVRRMAELVEKLACELRSQIP